MKAAAATTSPPPPQLPRLYPKQRAAICCTARYTVIEATTKAGKTAGCLIWMLTQAWNRGAENRHFWWVAPVIPQAKIAFRRMKRMLRQYDPQKETWDANETELRIDLTNGASMWFKGSDVPDTLYGEDVYAAVIDEASRCKEEAWHAVRSTLTATEGPLKIIGNVRGRKNWAYMLARKAEAGAPNMAYFKLTAYDAMQGGIVSAAEIEDARATLPEAVFKELYLAEPSDDGGNPFGLSAIKACVANTLAEPVPGREYVIGVDLAKSVDWTVIVVMEKDTGDVVNLERFQGPWETTILRIQTTASRYNQAPLMVDATGVGDPIVEALQRMPYL